MVLRRVALTGASGMLGRHVLEALAARGISCAATSRTRPARLPRGAHWTPWDLCEWRQAGALDDLFGAIDAVIHCGAPVPARVGDIPLQDLMDGSVRAALCLGRWALDRGVPLAFVSSTTVYAEPERSGIREGDPLACWLPLWDYSLSKLLSEEALRGLATAGLELVVLRPSSIYGAGLPRRALVRRFLDAAINGETIALSPPVEDRINMVHAADVADAALDALGAGARGAFNIAAEEAASVKEIAEACVAAAGSGSVRVSVGAGGTARPPITRFGLVTTAAREAFGFTPKLDLRSGIACMAKDTAPAAPARGIAG